MKMLYLEFFMVVICGCLLGVVEGIASSCASKRDGSIQAELIYINIDDYFGYTPTNTPEDCCKSCDEISARCNAWRFCNDPSGCGTGCKDYFDEWQNARKNNNTAWINKNAPIFSGNEDWTCGDKWPYKTCSFYIADTNSKHINQGAQASGWVSGDKGVIGVPAWKCSFNDPPLCCGPITPMYECADDSCGIRKSFIQADLLKFDQNLDVFRKYGGKYGSTPGSCCDICKENSECDAWVFCNRKEGCGTGCRETVEQLNKQGGNAFGALNPSTKLDVEKTCTKDDRFVFQSCQTRKFENGQYTEITSGEAALGWVSGIPDNN
eukprot:TRINITY_DN6180_c2_g1_i2.p1 TRINITY_DN6180_c2_g1~~TRINITY_DN6180_c2_g1_i2.p1  ORF type:complete len:322 (+),score=45.27 TRINITY_DN6180_c2_g1_i2:171-1136(+)